MKIWFLIIMIVLLTGCTQVQFQDNEDDGLICISQEDIPSLCKVQHIKDLNEMALNRTLNESEADIVITEGDLLDLNVTAIDPDGDLVLYNFSTPFENGKWQTVRGDAGIYVTEVIATDGLEIVTKNITIYVKTKNNIPIIIINETVYFDEGTNMVLPFEIIDEDGDEVVYTISGWPYGSRYPLNYESAGTYNVTITGDDSKDKVSKTIVAVINDVNRLPTISLQDVEVVEGQKVSIKPVVSDADGDKITVSFSEPLDENGEWFTKIGDEGEYVFDITADDGRDTVTEQFKLVIAPANKAPVLEEIQDVVVEETEVVRFTPLAFDPEGDEVTISYSGWMKTNEYTTTYDDAGEYIVTVTASDGEQTSFQHVKVTVLNKNRAPVFIK